MNSKQVEFLERKVADLVSSRTKYLDILIDVERMLDTVTTPIANDTVRSKAARVVEELLYLREYRDAMMAQLASRSADEG